MVPQPENFLVLQDLTPPGRCAILGVYGSRQLQAPATDRKARALALDEVNQRTNRPTDDRKYDEASNWHLYSRWCKSSVRYYLIPPSLLTLTTKPSIVVLSRGLEPAGRVSCQIPQPAQRFGLITWVGRIGSGRRQLLWPALDRRMVPPDTAREYIEVLISIGSDCEPYRAVEIAALEGLITTLAKTGHGGWSAGEQPLNPEPTGHYLRSNPGVAKSRGD